MSDTNSLSSSEHLLKRLDNDIRQVYAQLSVLEITFNNLKGSWLAISQAYKVYKIESDEKL